MIHSFKLKLLVAALGAMVLSGCGDAETTLIEKDPIPVSDDDHGHDDEHDHDDDHGNDITIESMGRLAVTEANSNMLHVFDLDDNSLLESFSTTYNGMVISASANYRYITAKARDENLMQFIDGGLWREDHGEHLHDYKQNPDFTTYEIMGSRPTHAISHDGQLAIFNDGDADSNTPASIHVLTDAMITTESEPREFIFNTNMHGVAEPRGEHLLATIRRDDAESTSANKILPDQVGVFHWHNGEYELEQTLAETCPNLHGATQNHEFVAFGCSDGVLVAHQHNDEYEAEKIANIDALNGLRIGNLYGYENSESFIGIASAHGGGNAVLVNINAKNNTMEALEWQPEFSPVAYAFSHNGEHFLVLDEQGYLTVLNAHEHDGNLEWELAGQLDISEEDVSTMPENMSFSMTVAQNGHYAYIADPIAQHVLTVHLEDMEIEGDMELSFAPTAITWAGIAKHEDNDHDDEHDHDHNE